MKKKVLVIMSAFMLGGWAIGANEITSYAQTNQDYSYLLTGDSIVGQMMPETKGVYLSSGTSVIRDAGVGKIVAGGNTIAAKKCDVSINVIVERLDGGSWLRVTSWTGSLKNTWSVTSSKTLSVGRGYYYRVRCLHSAHTDASSSMTSSLWR